MGEATGLLLPYLLEAEGNNFASGSVVGDDLHLFRQNGEEVNVGNVRGPFGPGEDTVVESGTYTPFVQTTIGSGGTNNAWYTFIHDEGTQVGKLRMQGLIVYGTSAIYPSANWMFGIPDGFEIDPHSSQPRIIGRYFRSTGSNHYRGHVTSHIAATNVNMMIRSVSGSSNEVAGATTYFVWTGTVSLSWSAEVLAIRP